MVTVARDAAQQLYRSVFAILHGDADLAVLLDAQDPLNPRIYQTFIDFDSAAAFKNAQWVTFGSVSDRPMAIEQMQDVREITLDVHIWVRGPGSDQAELIEKRIRELLDNGDLATDNLFVWYCLAYGYSKVYEAQPELWHVTSTYHILAMAIE